MTETAGSDAPTRTSSPRGSLKRGIRRAWHWIARAWTNPIVTKELRGRMRGWRAPVVLTVQLVVLSCFTSLIYLLTAEAASSSGSIVSGSSLGQILFYSTYILLLTIVVFLSPAFTAGALSGERERKTLDLLITTLLPARALVLGKLASALAYIVLLILIALPIQSLAVMFGGIVLAEMVIGTLILLVTALIAGSIGIFISSLMKSSIASTVLTYATILLASIGVPIVASIVIGFLGILVDPALNDVSWVVQAALVYLGGFILCTNPFSTAITTKVLEEEQNTLLFFTTQIADRQGGTHTIPLVSPWIVYVLFYTAVSALLILGSIVALKRKRG